MLQFEGVGFNTGTGAGGKIGTVPLIAMGSEPSTPYTVGSRWFYNGKIYTATSTTTTDGGVVPSYDTAYLYNGTYYYWDGSTLQGADESNLVHISGTETITGNKTFSGSVALGDNASAQTKPTSDTSNAVATTKFVKDFAEDGEWQKPADWVDIRSGALSNSIYFLVAHSKPVENEGVFSIANYPIFSVLAYLSNSANTYDVFVDGIKVATTAHNTTTEINWATLYNNGIIKGGFDIDNPGSGQYTSHIIRISPTVSVDNIIGIYQNYEGETGILWAHFEIDNEIDLSYFCHHENHNTKSLLIAAVTSKNNKILIKRVVGHGFGFYNAFYDCQSLEYICEIDCNNNTNVTLNSCFYNCKKIKKISLCNMPNTTVASEAFNSIFSDCEKLEIIKTKNWLMPFSRLMFNKVKSLKTLPLGFSFKDTTRANGMITRADNISPFFMDATEGKNMVSLGIYGESGHLTNLKGLVVSPEAPFSYATSPQIDVKYTGLDRAALVNLFKSLPYNVGYTAVGSPTIVDGVASGFSSSDYLALSHTIGIGQAKVIEINTKITTPASFDNSEEFIISDNLAYSYGIKFARSSTSRATFYLTSHSDGSYYTLGGTVNAVLPSTTYYIKGIIDGENGLMTLSVSTDGENWDTKTQEYTVGKYNDHTINYYIGRHSAIPFLGSIYVSDTSVKLNGLPYFRGTAAMTKTISVVGCTGTPDLTAADKAIAEDKGWSIALS